MRSDYLDWMGHFAFKLREIRAILGLTQHQMSLKLGVPHKLYGHYEAELSSPNLSTFLKICEALNTSADQLLELQPLVYPRPVDIFTERLFRAMRKREVDLYEVSKHTRISYRHMESWVNGVYGPTLEQVILIAGYLEVSVSYLCGESRQMDSRRKEKR